MKTNSHKITKRIWLSAAIGCAMLLMTGGSQSANAQTNTFPPSGNAGIGTMSPTQRLDVAGNIVTTGSQTLTVANKGVIEVTNTITNNASAVAAYRARNIFNGSGNLPEGLDVVPTFAPSANISITYAGLIGGWFAPPSGVTITDALSGNFVNVYSSVSGAITNGTTLQVDSPIILGSLKPTTQFGLRIKNQGASGITTNYGLYVDSQSGATNNYAAIFAGGNVGIGTTSPNARLTVSANTGTPPTSPSGTVGYFANVDGTNTILTMDSYMGGAGNAQHSDFLFRAARGTLASPTASQTDDIIGQIQARGYGTTGFAATARAGIRLIAAENWTDTAQGAYLSFLTTLKTTATLAEAMRITDAGNVGIGTSPASGNKLDVNGNTNVTGNLNASGTINAIGGVNFNGSPITSSQWTTSGSTINYTGGNIGIGATSPQSKLSINTSTQSPGSMLEINNRGDVAAGSWSAIRFGLDSNSYPNQYAKGGIIYESRDGYNRGKLHLVVNTAANTANMSLSDALLTVDGTTGNVGIGSTTPGSKLDVAGNINSTGTINATGLNINGSPVTSSQWNGTTTIFYTGNVGIGTNSPNSSYKLDVNGNTNVTGNINITGNINGKYQDMAEWVASSEQLATGTVVVLDSTKSNQVISSTQAYDTRVAGVISEQPGIALGESGGGKVLVATTGRVLVNVDATISPIHIGDLLVTSDSPGMAMKSVPVNLGGVQLHRPGTLIGKALEPLEKGSGKILVLLSLQ